jgi:hypothetical protein
VAGAEGAAVIAVLWTCGVSNKAKMIIRDEDGTPAMSLVTARLIAPRPLGGTYMANTIASGTY